MALTFADMTAELVARGFDSLTPTRQGYLVNAARAELDEAFLWPWRETTQSGAAPLTVTTLGPISSVQDASGNKLSRVDVQTLIERYGDLTLTGTPWAYYVTTASAVAVYPVSTASITVKHWKVPPDLTGVQTPLSPSKAHYTIVDIACRRAYRDLDDHASAQALQPEIDNAISQLLASYPPGQQDGPDFYVGVTGASVDG